MARWTSSEHRQFTGTQTEHELQCDCVAWFRRTYPALVLFAIPNGASLNGTKLQRAIQWKRLEREGALPGVADLLLMQPSGDLAGLWIEMKTGKGKQSERQADFERLAIASGFGYAMPRNLEQFQTIVRNYLEKGEY